MCAGVRVERREESMSGELRSSASISSAELLLLDWQSSIEGRQSAIGHRRRPCTATTILAITHSLVERRLRATVAVCSGQVERGGARRLEQGTACVCLLAHVCVYVLVSR